MKLSPVSFLFRQAHARPLACFSAFFLVGLILQDARNVPIPTILVLCTLTALGVAFTRMRIRTVFVLLLAICLGMARMSLSSPIIPLTEDRFSVSVYGTVDSQPYIKSDTGRLIFQFRTHTVNGAKEESLIRMYLRGEPDDLECIEYGQTLSVTGHIWAPDPVTNPAEFDFGAYLAASGMCAYGTAKIEDVDILSASRDVRSVLFDVRSAISGRIDILFPENAAIVKALVLSDRSHLDDDIRESFNETGITHLICISGMHVSVLAAAALFLLRRFLPRKPAIGAVFFLLIVYGVLIGFTPSYIRAVIMFMILSCAPVAGYYSDGVTRLCCALFLSLMIAPRQIFDAGFVLSYTATAGIILLYPPLTDLFGLTEALGKKPASNKRARYMKRMLFYFPKLLCATLSAQLATIPVVIASFGIQSVISVPTNLLCVPLCMLGYPVALIALILSSVFMPVARLIAFIPEMLFGYMSRIALAAAALPVTGIRIGKYTFIPVLLHCCVILASSNLSRIKAGIRRFLPLALVPVAALSSLIVYTHGLGHSVIFLDAGQADCAVVRTEGKTFLIDTGDTYTPAPNYLDAHCLSLDAVFLSHPDEDHSGGLAEVLGIIRPGAVYIPNGWNSIEGIADSVCSGLALAKDMGVPIVELSAGDTVRISENTSVHIYGPDGNSAHGDSNGISMVLTVDHKDRSVLFSGDVPTEYEPADIPKVDILKVAHHGSDESTSNPFIRRADPAYAVISVGENNFGHPSDDVINRLEDSGARIFRTDKLGAITFKLDKNGKWQTDTWIQMEALNELE